MFDSRAFYTFLTSFSSWLRNTMSEMIREFFSDTLLIKYTSNQMQILSMARDMARAICGSHSPPVVCCVFLCEKCSCFESVWTYGSYGDTLKWHRIKYYVLFSTFLFISRANMCTLNNSFRVLRVRLHRNWVAWARTVAFASFRDICWGPIACNKHYSTVHCVHYRNRLKNLVAVV